MALLEKYLRIKKSSIPDAGKGLYTTVFIPKHTLIVEYKGRITTWKEVEYDSTNGYIYTVNTKHVIDAKRTLKALARYANDALGLTRVKGVKNNCHFLNDGLRVYIESARDIEAGEEILVDYGKKYWDVVKENIKTAKKEERARLKEILNKKIKAA
ncbi:MAG TPA: SET domain-containing protein [Chitinophagaceae bacterium]|jgi:SET domain-containing protein|nr:SET domain-containing protein [Chitinophagaceae bacterium]